MTFKFIGNWKDQFFGVEINKTAYYIAYQKYPEHRFWGFNEDWYDGPIRTWSAWYFFFQIVY